LKGLRISVPICSEKWAREIMCGYFNLRCGFRDLSRNQLLFIAPGAFKELKSLRFL
jgi:hypothetical protein